MLGWYCSFLLSRIFWKYPERRRRQISSASFFVCASSFLHSPAKDIGSITAVKTVSTAVSMMQKKTFCGKLGFEGAEKQSLFKWRGFACQFNSVSVIYIFNNSHLCSCLWHFLSGSRSHLRNGSNWWDSVRRGWRKKQKQPYTRRIMKWYSLSFWLWALLLLPYLTVFVRYLI